MLNFSHSYTPATDAAYYPMQTREWLVHGRLMYDDLPLMFWLDAALTKALIASGKPMDDAAICSSMDSDRRKPGVIDIAAMRLPRNSQDGRIARFLTEDLIRSATTFTHEKVSTMRSFGCLGAF